MKQWFKNPKQIKVGVVGYGGAFNMGRHHLKEMKRAGMSPRAVCDLAPDRLQVAQDDFPGIEAYPTLDRLLKNSDVNLITIITPHNTHAPLALKALRAGKHVVCEKPLAITTVQCNRMIAAAQKSKVICSTYHNRHWDGWITRAVSRIVDQGLIGDVFRVECHMGSYGAPNDWWRTSKSISGGVLYDWGVHLLEYALQVVRSDLTEVSGFARTGYWESQAQKGFPWKGDCNEDEATAVIRLAGGELINLSVSQLDPSDRPHLAFHGTKGSYEIRMWGGEDEGVNDWGWRTRTPNRSGKIVERTGKHPRSRSHLFYQNVADHLTGQAKLIITPQWARRPIHLLDLADRSAKAGRALKTRYP